MDGDSTESLFHPTQRVLVLVLLRGLAFSATFSIKLVVWGASRPLLAASHITAFLTGRPTISGVATGAVDGALAPIQTSPIPETGACPLNARASARGALHQ